ncbi:NupC/NupG family nucleoside CNT transporter [bacterium]|nr:NupC/NupG family nucleoside CNT transporter [bacterium]
MERFISGLGLIVFLFIAYLLSENRKKIIWKYTLFGVLLQLIFALLILKTAPGLWLFQKMNGAVSLMMDFTKAGTAFVFGGLLKEWSFALSVLPTIVFFSSFFAVLYYFGILQFFVRIFAWILKKALGTSGAESLSAAANIFLGQTEAPLMVRPYVAKMTRSELFLLMVGGMSTVAGGVLAAFVGMGISAGHLIAASVMSAPAAIIIAKIMIPETESSATADGSTAHIPIEDKNAIEAAARGATEGLTLALNVLAMLIAFIAGVAFINYFFSLFGTSMEEILGFIFRPVAWIMGVPWSESASVGSLLGQKTILNEFIAYQNLSAMVKDSAIHLSARSQVIATYALCGFANLGSIAIQIGGLGAMAPERRGEIAALGIKALIAGSIASFMTATIAGILV